MAVSRSLLVPPLPEGILPHGRALAGFALSVLRERLRRRPRASVGELNPHMLADLGLQRVILPDGSSVIRPRPVFE